MTDEAFYKRLAEISEQTRTLPANQRTHMLRLAEEARRRHEQIKRETGRARDALDDWRLAMKYRIFDLEARLRERGPAQERGKS